MPMSRPTKLPSCGSFTRNTMATAPSTRKMAASRSSRCQGPAGSRPKPTWISSFSVAVPYPVHTCASAF